MIVEKGTKVGGCVSNIHLNLNNIDKLNWITYRFDKIAQKISKTVKPEESENGRHARIMADAILEKLLKAPPIDWAGGHKLETMGERRTEYIAALRSADRGDIAPLLKFAGI